MTIDEVLILFIDAWFFDELGRRLVDNLHLIPFLRKVFLTDRLRMLWMWYALIENALKRLVTFCNW
jgi:hypothetical protein